MSNYHLGILKGTAEAASMVSQEIFTQAESGEIKTETVEEALEILTQFRRGLRTVANGGEKPTRAKRNSKKA